MPRRARSMVSPDQLKMLMSAREIVEQFSPLDNDRILRMPRPETLAKVRSGEITREEMYANATESDEQVWARKLEERGGGVLTRAIPTIPLTHQVGSRGRPQVGGGHHRIASYNAKAPDELLPVEHFETPTAARNSRGYT